MNGPLKTQMISGALTAANPGVESPTSSRKNCVSHTPGPWRVTEEYGRALASDETELCFHAIRDAKYDYIASTWGEPHEANARLIAAAPALAEQLRLAIQHIALLNDTLYTLTQLGATVAICGAEYKDADARAALAEAGVT